LFSTAHIVDAARVMIECRDFEAMARVLQILKKEKAVTVRRVKNRWESPAPGGWADIMINISLSGSLAANKAAALAKKAHRIDLKDANNGCAISFRCGAAGQADYYYDNDLKVRDITKIDEIDGMFGPGQGFRTLTLRGTSADGVMANEVLEVLDTEHNVQAALLFVSQRIGGAVEAEQNGAQAERQQQANKEDVKKQLVLEIQICHSKMLKIRSKGFGGHATYNFTRSVREMDQTLEGKIGLPKNFDDGLAVRRGAERHITITGALTSNTFFGSEKDSAAGVDVDIQMSGDAAEYDGNVKTCTPSKENEPKRQAFADGMRRVPSGERKGFLLP